MQSKISTAIILAGGLGTRLKSVVSDVPKPMAPIQSTPFLEIVINYWINQGIKRIILSVGYMSDIIINHFGKSFKDISIEYVDEVSPLGTGGALKNVLNKLIINDPFLVINGDTFFEVDLDSMTLFHFNNKSNWTFALFNSRDSDRYMQFELSKTSRIVGLSKKSRRSSFFSNGGIYLISDKSIITSYSTDKIRFSLEEDVITESINKNNLFGFKVKDTFIDIGVPLDYKKANTTLKKFM